MKEKILAKLVELRNDDLAAMEFAAGRSVEMMQAYCNVRELPEELMGVGVVLAGLLLDNGMAGMPVSRAKSIREGDISVTFATCVSENGIEMLPEGLKAELERYRKMEW